VFQSEVLLQNMFVSISHDVEEMAVAFQLNILYFITVFAHKSIIQCVVPSCILLLYTYQVVNDTITTGCQDS